MTDAPPVVLVPRVVHGGARQSTGSVLDFSVNSNPYGANPVLLKAMREADVTCYPSPDYPEVRESLAQYHDVASECIALGVGASEIFYRAVRAFVRRGVLSFHAPFGELARAAQVQGSALWQANTLDDLLLKLATYCPELVYVSLPHNPTGQNLSLQELKAVAAACTQVGALLLVDLAYWSFLSPQIVPHAELLQGVLWVHSPGKVHGVVGARLAYAVALPDVVSRLDNLAPAWQVPSPSAAALRVLPQANEFLRQTVPLVQAAAAALANSLAAQSWEVIRPESTPYCCVKTTSAACLSELLTERGIQVRDCSSYGFSNYVRISTRTPQENAELLKVMAEIR